MRSPISWDPVSSPQEVEEQALEPPSEGVMRTQDRHIQKGKLILFSIKLDHLKPAET